MSDQQIAASSHFCISYVPAASNIEFPIAPSANKSVANYPSLQILRAKSIEIAPCGDKDWDPNDSSHSNTHDCDKPCRRKEQTDWHTSCENKCCNMLALLVSPEVTHKYLEKEDNFPSNNEDEIMKSLHPCLYEEVTNQATHTAATLGRSENREAATVPRISIHALITSGSDSALPADVVLFELANSTSNLEFTSDMLRYSSLLNHEATHDAPWSVMKAFPVCSISPLHNPTNIQSTSAMIRSDEYDRRKVDNHPLPCCPVCLHRIDPTALGLPEFKHHHKCSQWCSSFGNHLDKNDKQHTCTNEMKLEPWPPPAICNACDVIRQRDSTLGVESTRDNAIPSLKTSLKCHKCGMTTTLWVCLTCGVIGCGRYTLKHAADHFNLTRHPFSLELATMRIWDYRNGSFVHRKDLLECPILSAKWGNCSSDCASPLLATSQSAENDGMSESPSQQYLKSYEEVIASPGQNSLSPLHYQQPTCERNLRQNLVPDKTSYPPKKSVMISEEYEALLQSALEDQAMHFEGEISHLRAELASSRIRQSESISHTESRQIDGIRKDSERLKCELENLSSAMLEIQSEESKSRALSQKLLREQQISKELLEKLRHDIRSERDSCRRRMDDLELQIEDLTTNLRMRTQIAQSEELNEAQIFGTIGGKESDNNKKKGKKSIRFGRRK